MRMSERTSELKERGNVKGLLRKFRVRKARVVAQSHWWQIPEVNLNSQIFLSLIVR